MNAQDLAHKLVGLQYPVNLPKELVAQAKSAGLVIVYGASDDLMEFEGAFRDELGCYDGGTANVDRKGLLPAFEDLDTRDRDALRDFFQREKSVVPIQALWCAEPGYSWTYKTDLPHATFEVAEDSEPYCRGIVFAMADVDALHPKQS